MDRRTVGVALGTLGLLGLALAWRLPGAAPADVPGASPVAVAPGRGVAAQVAPASGGSGPAPAQRGGVEGGSPRPPQPLAELARSLEVVAARRARLEDVFVEALDAVPPEGVEAAHRVLEEAVDRLDTLAAALEERSLEPLAALVALDDLALDTAAAFDAAGAPEAARQVRRRLDLEEPPAGWGEPLEAAALRQRLDAEGYGAGQESASDRSKVLQVVTPSAGPTSR